MYNLYIYVGCRYKLNINIKKIIAYFFSLYFQSMYTSYRVNFCANIGIICIFPQKEIEYTRRYIGLFYR